MGDIRTTAAVLLPRTFERRGGQATGLALRVRHAWCAAWGGTTVAGQRRNLTGLRWAATRPGIPRPGEPPPAGGRIGAGAAPVRHVRPASRPRHTE